MVLDNLNNIKRILIIENPKAGQGNSNLDQFKVSLFEKGVLLKIRELNDSVQIKDLLVDAEEFDCVVTAGGDGTVCSVSHELCYRNIPVFVYPAGTANLIAQNLGVTTNTDHLIKVMFQGKTVEIDMPVVNCEDVTSGFIVAAGAGVDAEMIKDSESFKPQLGTLAYFVGAMKQVNNVEADIKLTIDGKVIETKGISVIVSNLGMINFRIPLAKGIDPTDGNLNVIILKGPNILSIIPNIMDSLKHKFNIGEPAFEDNLEMYEGKNVFVETNPPLTVQYDGELLQGKTPFNTIIQPRAVKFFYADPEIKT